MGANCVRIKPIKGIESFINERLTSVNDQNDPEDSGAMLEGFLSDARRILERCSKDSWAMLEGFLSDARRILEPIPRTFRWNWASQPITKPKHRRERRDREEATEKPKPLIRKWLGFQFGLDWNGSGPAPLWWRHASLNVTQLTAGVVTCQLQRAPNARNPLRNCTSSQNKYRKEEKNLLDLTMQLMLRHQTFTLCLFINSIWIWRHFGDGLQLAHCLLFIWFNEKPITLIKNVKQELCWRNFQL